MRIFRSYLQLPDSARGAVVVLGNFDGLHRGHQEVIGRGRALAAAAGLPLAVLTFEPHPRSVFRPDGAPFRLTPFRIKERQLEAFGVDILVVAHFDEAFLHRDAGNFVSEILVGGLAARHIVAGADFHFGHRRGGSMEFLAHEGAKHGFRVEAVGLVPDHTGAVLSSTRIRTALVEGRPRDAAFVLGRAWEIEGRVEPGARLGRDLGFPTANLHLGEYLRPRLGAYAVRAGIDTGRATVWHDGVANFGRRPTVNGEDERLEAHLFDCAEDLYGRHLRVQLIEFLRPEHRFESLDALKTQIGMDVLAAKAALKEPSRI